MAHPIRSTLQRAALALLLACSGASAQAGTCPALLDRSFESLDSGRPQSLCQYAGRVLLIVNTASHCGFSPQERGLQALLDKYGPQGFVVLGFPSNDFHQEIDDPTRIAPYSRATYGASFPLFAPSHVTGSDANPLFADLIRASGTSPKWNFYKYLVDRNGKVVGSYSSLTSPDDPDLNAQIRRLLAQHR